MDVGAGSSQLYVKNIDGLNLAPVNDNIVTFSGNIEVGNTATVATLKFGDGSEQTTAVQTDQALYTTSSVAFEFIKFGPGSLYSTDYMTMTTYNTNDIDIYTNNYAGGSSEVWLRHNASVDIITDNGSYSWSFDTTGTLHFPDGSTQTTAYKGLVGYSDFLAGTSELTATNAGSCIQLWGNDVTLPAGSSMRAGDSFTFSNEGGSTQSINIWPDSGDFIFHGWGIINTSTLEIRDSETVVIASRGGNEWDIVGGTLPLRYQTEVSINAANISGTAIAPNNGQVIIGGFAAATGFSTSTNDVLIKGAGDNIFFKNTTAPGRPLAIDRNARIIGPGGNVLGFGGNSGGFSLHDSDPNGYGYGGIYLTSGDSNWMSDGLTTAISLTPTGQYYSAADYNYDANYWFQSALTPYSFSISAFLYDPDTDTTAEFRSFDTNSTTSIISATDAVSTATLTVAADKVSVSSIFQLAVYTDTELTAITGAAGQMACVSNSSGGGNPNGMIAFWDTTNSRWSYIHDNSAV